jgi:hypothetical protein
MEGSPPPPFYLCCYLLCCFNKGSLFFGVSAPKMEKRLFSRPVLGWSGWFSWVPWQTISHILLPGFFFFLLFHESTGFDLRRPVLFLGVAPTDVSLSKIWTPFMDLPAELRSPMVLLVLFVKAVADLEYEAICFFMVMALANLMVAPGCLQRRWPLDLY